MDTSFITTIIALGGVGIITVTLKEVPVKLFNFAKKQLTTEVIINNSDAVFYEILKWIETKHGVKNFRNLKLTNGKWGYDEETTVSMGYGIHTIKFKNKKLFLSLVKEDSSKSEKTKEILTITQLGRERELIDQFIKEIKTFNIDKDKIDVYCLKESNWQFVRKQPKRSLDTVLIESDKLSYLKENIDNFINNEEWYNERGIPYQLGILLHGTPGSGKTSLIKGIAAYLNYPIYYLSPSNISDINGAMMNLPNNCLLVIEDIDSNKMLHSRQQNKIIPLGGNNNAENSLFEEMMQVGISDILNALDGIFAVHGRILITTTNHIEKLDAAVIRPGRIDLKVEMNYVNEEIFELFVKKFFDNKKYEKFSISQNRTVAELQQMILEKKSLDSIIEYLIH